MKYEYKTATEVIEIEVTEEWYEALKEQDRIEYNVNQKERRRHASFDHRREGEWLATWELDPCELLEREIEDTELKESFKLAISSLTDDQRNLVYRRFCLKKQLKEIAEEDGCTHQAVSNRLKKIANKMKKFV